MANNNIELVRVNMNLPKKLVKRVNDYALELGIPNTQAYIMLLSSQLNSMDSMKQLPNVKEMIDKIDKLSKDKDFLDKLHKLEG